MTTALPNREERRAFLEERRQGVGGSDVAAIVGLDPYKTALDVYLDKVRPPQEGDVENIHLIRGQLLEDVFAELYAETTGRDLRRMGQRVHPEFDWARVNVDRQILSPGNGKSTGALEVKSPGRQTFQNLIEAGLPERYLVQLQWEMFVPDYDWGSFAAGNLEHSGGPLIHFDLERNDLLIEQLVERVETFWVDHVRERRPPDPDTWGEETPEVPDTSGERELVDDPEVTRAVHVLMRRYQLRKEAKDAYSEQKERVQELMGDIERIQVPGQGKVNYIWQQGRTRFDDDTLREYGALDPDAVVRYLREAEGSQVTVEELLEHCELDLSLFESEGSPYRRFRPYPADHLEPPKEGDDG